MIFIVQFINNNGRFFAIDLSIRFGTDVQRTSLNNLNKHFFDHIDFHHVEILLLKLEDQRKHSSRNSTDMFAEYLNQKLILKTNPNLILFLFHQPQSPTINLIQIVSMYIENSKQKQSNR